VLKYEGAAALSTPVTSLPVMKTTRFNLPQKCEDDRPIYTVSMFFYVAVDCNITGFTIYFRGWNL
jgi:hypothetical protein